MSFRTSPFPDCDIDIKSAVMPEWYAVYTYPRHEKTVAQHLENKAVEVFLPTFEVVSRWKDRDMKIQTPLFPGYVFTRICTEERIKVVTVPSVVRVLSFNGAPCPISESEIEAIRLCVASGAKLEPYTFLEVGEKVRVRSGAFEGVEGIVIRHKGSCKLVVSVTLIQQSLALEIDASRLESLSNHKPSSNLQLPAAAHSG